MKTLRNALNAPSRRGHPIVKRRWLAPAMLVAALFADAGLVTNSLGSVQVGDVRPAAGMALRVLLPIGAFSGEYAVPIAPQLGDDPRGRFHFSVALRY